MRSEATDAVLAPPSWPAPRGALPRDVRLCVERATTAQAFLAEEYGTLSRSALPVPGMLDSIASQAQEECRDVFTQNRRSVLLRGSARLSELRLQEALPCPAATIALVSAIMRPWLQLFETIRVGESAPLTREMISGCPWLWPRLCAASGTRLDVLLTGAELRILSQTEDGRRVVWKLIPPSTSWITAWLHGNGPVPDLLVQTAAISETTPSRDHPMSTPPVTFAKMATIQGSSKADLSRLLKTSPSSLLWLWWR